MFKNKKFKEVKKLHVNKTLYACIILLLFWSFMHWVVNSSAIPSPFKTIMNFIEIFPGTLALHVLISLGRIIAAILISLVLGSIIGLWIGLSEKADSWVSPLVYILYPLPKIAFLPILMILFGLGETPKILLIVFIIILNL